MSLLTITKLTDSVGAEVVGLDPAALARRHARRSSAGCAGRQRRAGLSRTCISTRKLRWRSAGASVRSTTPPTATTRLPGIYPITLDKSKNASAAYLQATFDWHIDGCTPIGDECPQKATVLSAVQVAERGGETEFANSYAAYDALSDEEKERYRRRCGWCIRWKRHSAACHPDPTPEQVGSLASPPHPRASAGVDPPQRPEIAGARRLRRLHRGHGSRRGPRAARRAAGPTPRCRTRSTAILVGRRHRDLGQPRRPAPRGALRPRLAA